MTTRKTSLRSVPVGEAASPPVDEVPKSVTTAASKGTTRELLVAMRDRVAKTVENENTPARDLAALSKRLMEIVRDIAAIDAQAEQEANSDAAEVEDGDFDASAV